jgi:hypothetical protein
MKTELILSYAAAEHRMQKLAERRYGDMSVDAIQKEAVGQLEQVQRTGRRMLNDTADFGVVLEALKTKSPHGTYLDRLEKLGVTKSSADRYRKLAIYRAALPKNPPLELYGAVWTDSAALEFGQALLEMKDDLPEEERMKKTTERVQAKRARHREADLPKKVFRLEIEITTGLEDGAPGAQQAVDLLEGAVARLKDRAAKANAAQVQEEEEEPVRRGPGRPKAAKP